MTDPEKPLAEGNRQMAYRPSPDDALASIMENCKVPYYCSFDIESALQQSAINAALLGESVEIRSVINLPLDIYGYLLRPSDPKILPDGEIRVYPVTLLLSTDGRCIRSGSEGVLKSIRLYESEQPATRRQWSPAIRVWPRMRSLSQPNVWIYLSKHPPTQE